MNSFFENFKVNNLRKKSTLEYDLSKILLRNAFKISVAESCTGGLISSRLTDVAGSSAYIRANFVTYSNEAKNKILNVSEETLKNHGAVSEECAFEMAKGLMQLTKSEVVLCTTGVAGPSASEEKPVGLIYIACGYKDSIVVKKFNLNPKLNRKNMKFMFSETALKMVLNILDKRQ
ncbi:CinA family protein [bacterium]|nr:CinA family protein [bacterium]